MHIRPLTQKKFSIYFLAIMSVNCSNPPPLPHLLSADNTRMKYSFLGGWETEGEERGEDAAQGNRMLQ